MITYSLHEDNCVSFMGLSSDEKPSYDWLKNGSSFSELDTSSIYFYNKPGDEKGDWIKWTGGIIDFMTTGWDESVKQMIGLSSDEKPTGFPIGNGSRFIEMDSGKIYVFDEKNTQWLEWKGNGGGGGEGKEYVAGENVKIEGNVISAVDTKYTAGRNVEITEDNVINAQTSSELIAELVAGRTVGGIAEGTVFPAGTPIEDIITQLLEGTHPTPIEGKLFWATVDNVPDGMTADFEEEDIPGSIMSTGIKHTYATRGEQYECAIFPTKLGEVKTIYENGLPFNLLENYVKKDIQVQGESYYLYYYQDPVMADGDEFEFRWR